MAFAVPIFSEGFGLINLYLIANRALRPAGFRKVFLSNTKSDAKYSKSLPRLIHSDYTQLNFIKRADPSQLASV